MLIDSYKRNHNYLRVSVTDKCNLRCRYCMPPEGVKYLAHDQILRNEEFIRLIGIFIQMGVIKVRFTGGEPLVRRGFLDIVKETRNKFPDIELALTTNGVLLEQYLDELYKIGLLRLNISLDSLNPERYSFITGKDELGSVLSAIDRALEIGFPTIKINAVLFRETLDEVEDFIDYFSERACEIRFIEMMPTVGDDQSMRFLPGDDLLASMEKLGSLQRITDADTRVACMYNFTSHSGKKLRIGVIPPVTHKFCDRCNRLRLTSEGRLKTCLYAGTDTDLKKIIRSGKDDKAVMEAIHHAVSKKNKSHHLNIFKSDGGCHAIRDNGGMSKIGG